MSNTFGIDAKMDHGRWPKTMANGLLQHSQGLRCWNTICTMSYFYRLTTEWKDIHAAASKAESNAVPDPRTSCFYARRALELAVGETV